MLTSFVEKHDKKVNRFFEIILGAFTWTLLLSPIWLGLLYPPAVVYLLAFLTVYWSYLGFKHARGLHLGYKRYSKEIKVDWWKECKKHGVSFIQELVKVHLLESFKELYI